MPRESEQIMKLLVDTSVLIDGYLKRKPFYEDWREIRLIQMLGDVELWAPAKSFTDVHYVASRVIDTHKVQEVILASLDYLHVCSIDGGDIKRAAEAQWRDFEDCVVYQAARKTKADYILTRNKAGFTNADIPAVTPQEFLAKIHEEFEFEEE